MLSYESQSVKNMGYYGLKSGQLLGYNLVREEKFFFQIYSDGSSSVNIRTKEGREYIFGGLFHCRRLYRNKISFYNKPEEKNYILTKAFLNVLQS